MTRFSLAFFAGVGAMLAGQTSSAQTVAVGNCRPHLVSYSTISAAVADVAPNSTVLVCPGTYPEQVTISQPLTLKGLKAGTGAYPVVAVPSGGFVGNSGVQLFVEATDLPLFGPVSISNLVVDGAGSGFDCSKGDFTGIEYVFASGSLEKVEVRNQNPGGCGFGVSLVGSPFGVNTVNVRNCSIHDFDDTGILATSGGATAFLVNVSFSSVASASTSVQAGVDYESTDGLTAHNTIVLAGGIGLWLDNFYPGMTARGNTIVGSDIGILSGSDEVAPTVIVNNRLFNNRTGIVVSGLGAGAVVKSNSITQSRIAAIDLDCSQDSTAENNTIFGAPVGIANVTAGDTVRRNTFYSVPTLTTACPF